LIAIHDTISKRALISTDLHSFDGGSFGDSIDNDSIKEQNVQIETNTTETMNTSIKSVPEKHGDFHQEYKQILQFIKYPRNWMVFLMVLLIGIKRRYFLDKLHQILKMIPL
jgi:hypothetical protein